MSDSKFTGLISQSLNMIGLGSGVFGVAGASILIMAIMFFIVSAIFMVTFNSTAEYFITASLPLNMPVDQPSVAQGFTKLTYTKSMGFVAFLYIIGMLVFKH